ncbi:hypothetical protein SAMN05192534_12390 [Alteribacillus persepolensis]|uniref:Ribbon-helix-helix protein, copG family n=1 Tax=Alteribacillus persepolensis TaxID=568899 RepID=A0A1G8ICK1_9BACI|nr:hypothetical protein [Alteribacillus persepolensis]SDI16655.1 hypothetical protein SAMN05192534_12390 [Alteribacillus persepolensis]
MDAHIMVRIDKKQKEAFIKKAKEQGADASTLIRMWVHDYLKEGG